MVRLRWLSILMTAVMLVITGFQVYWLKDNYAREKLALETRTNSLFRETVQYLQDSMLHSKFVKVLRDSGAGTIKGDKGRTRQYKMPSAEGALRILSSIQRDFQTDSVMNRRIGKGDIKLRLRGLPGEGAGDTGRKFFLRLDSINPENIREMMVVNAKRQGSGKGDPGFSQETGNPAMIKITSDDTGRRTQSARIETIFLNNENGDKVMIRMDSLFKDSIPVEKIAAEFAKVLKAEKLSVPFSVHRQSSPPIPQGPHMRRPAFASDYALELTKPFSFLVRKISLPILFSLFLVGITLLSFILLYRSLLRQHRLAQFKNDLISNITHELKTPIATVGVAIEALKNFNAIHDTRKTNEYLEISQQELQRLGLLVDKVLKLSMFENRNIEISKEPVDMSALVNEVVASLRLQIEKYHAEVTVHAEGDPGIQGDKLHLLSVVFNLLDNALKYSKDRPIVNISIVGNEKNITLKMTDNGIGIPAPYREKIFEKFFRVPTGDTHNAKGHGLGLSYSAHVVRQHNGTISVDSEEGRGSTFTIIIPKSNT